MNSHEDPVEFVIFQTLLTKQQKSNKMSEKPAVLVLGGTGCVGRNLVKLLVDSNKYSRIRVADKKPPMTAFLDADFKAAFDNPIVEFKQVNLSSEGKCEVAHFSCC